MLIVMSVTGRIGGTSASTPAFSGVVALLNDYLLSQGKPPLGFLNPWLYSIGRNGLNGMLLNGVMTRSSLIIPAFTDVLSGSAAGCNTTGFPAQKGWGGSSSMARDSCSSTDILQTLVKQDAVSGLGTPDFLKLKGLL